MELTFDAINYIAPEQDITRQRVKRLVLSCMETGNFDVARTTMAEFKAVDGEGAQALNNDILQAYNTVL